MKAKSFIIIFIIAAASFLMYLSLPQYPEVKEITKEINVTTR